MPIIRTGTKGADKFFAAAAAETFSGLANYDIVSYANTSAAVTVDLSNPGNNSGWAAGDTFTGVEKFILGRGNDTFVGTSAKDTIDGYYGNDTLSTLGGDDLVSGHAGNDTINGGAGADSIWGGGGDDTLDGGNDNDLVVGDKGNDIIDGGAGNDILQGGTGNDTIIGGLGTDTVRLLGNLADYDITFTAGGVIVTHARGSQADGTDFIASSIETFQFANATIARPVSGPTVTFGTVAFTDTGASASDGVTNNGAVTFSGTVSDVDGTITKVEVFNGSVSLGLATVTGNTWSLATSLADGAYTNLKAVATDNDSVTSTATHSQQITVDRAAPVAPSAPDLSTATDSLPVDNDNITNIQSLDLSGTAEAGATVRLYNATTGALLATTVATGGAYAFTVTVPSGTYSFATTAEDAAGNVSASSGALSVLVDTQASSVVGVTVAAGSIGFTAADDHGPLSLVGTFAGLGAVNNGLSTTLTLAAQSTAKSGLLQVQDIAGNPSTVMGLGLGTTGADTLTGASTGANALYGFAGDDVLTGNSGTDVLFGGDGNDRLVVTAGGDTYNGDANLTGGDTLDFANAASAVTFSLAGAATQSTGASFGSLTWFGLENIFGGAAGDTLTGSSSANVLDGKGGNDILTGGAGLDTFVISSGTDTITDLGNGGADVVTVAGGASLAATLTGAWTATATSTNSGSASIATAGFSASVASAGGSTGWTLTNAASATAVTLTGGAFADTLIGGSGADTLVGGAGADTLNGGIGGDILTGGDGADSINLGVFNDNVRDYVRYGATTEFGDTVTNFDVDSTQDMIQFTGALYTSLDDGRTNGSLRWASGNNTSLLSVAVTVGQGNNDREALMLSGSAGEGVTSANLSSASAVSAAINAEFIITAADGEDAVLVVNDTDSTNFSVWHWVQAGGGETSAAEISLIGVFSANGTVGTGSFGFA
ncbi:MAG: Ig-like domain-containing protein [Hyphomicrobiaceae bacterium]